MGVEGLRRKRRKAQIRRERRLRDMGPERARGCKHSCFGCQGWQSTTINLVALRPPTLGPRIAHTTAGHPRQALIAMGLLDKPFALFGHSFGALVMFELARKLAEVAGKAPLCLIVSGCQPPDVSCGSLAHRT